MTRQPPLEELLGQVFDSFQDVGNSHDQRREEFVFHMTDWQDDLRELAELYQHPTIFSREQACKSVSAFLYHAVGHLSAASRLLVDQVSDPFGPNSKPDAPGA